MSTSNVTSDGAMKGAMKFGIILTLALGGLFAVAFILLASQTSGGVTGAQFVKGLFAADSLQFWWYLTRAAGLAGYFLLWLSTAWGLLVSTKFLDALLDRTFTYDFHEYLSLLGLGFILLHIIVLMFDHFAPLSIWQILIPFVEPYRPFWVGLGIIGFYLTVLVTVTFYMRSQIGMSAFRKIHYLSLVGYASATLHGLYAGTDSVLPAANFLYKGTFLVTLFLLLYLLFTLWYKKREERELQLSLARHRNKRTRASYK